jgi:Beta-lactamase class C and other penicillin binding proteins
MSKFRTRFILLSAVLLSIFSVGQTRKETSPKAQAAAAPKQAVAPQTAAHEMTPADVEAFLDGFMPMQLERENIAGSVVLIVKDNQVLFAKGYGYSDVKTKKPVTVDATLFRPGSISKLFTWTAVMQLVEQGKIDLDHDVNDYLDFKIPDAYGKPITVRNLMTHTPGFQEMDKNLLSGEDFASEPVGQYLRDHIPARIFPPGVTPAYSNYGASLGGIHRAAGLG